MKRKTSIDFFGIGAQKAGTSWLYANLSKLPDFDLPYVKELHFFDRSPAYSSPNNLSETALSKRLLDLRWTKRALSDLLSSAMKERDYRKTRFYWNWYFSDYTDNWYLSLFENRQGKTGEITPSYSILDQADIQRMYDLAPEAKLVFILRDPVSRAWSQYRFNTREINGFDRKYEDEAAIIEFIDSGDQDLRSDYLQVINKYAAVYPKEQILLGFYDAILDNPTALLTDIIEFIGGDPQNVEQLQLNKRVNVSKQIACPPRVRQHLETKYYPQVRMLADTYGGYCHQWLQDLYGETSTNPRKELLPTIRLA
jgi:hypothetical protein